MERFTRTVLAHRRLIVLIWLAALLAGGAAASALNTRLSQSFEIPGTPSAKADAAIIATFGSGGSETPLVPVVKLPPGATVRQPAVRSDLRAGFAAAGVVASRQPTPLHARPARVVSYGTVPSPSLASADGRTTFGLIFTPTNGNPAQDPVVSTTAIRAALLAHLPAGSQVQVTGITPLTDAGGGAAGTGLGGEIIIGGLGALAVLAFVFASFLALMPLLVAAASITTAFLAIVALTYLTPISFITQYLVGLIGLGVAIDYSLLFVTRWREEAARGADNEAAISAAMATAGRSVVFSGVTVALGLLALIALPIPFIRSIGLGGMLIPLISVAVTLTLLPALLAGGARRLDWPRVRGDIAPSRFWTAWARLVIRWRWVAAGAALAILVLLGTAALSMRVGDASVNALSQRGSARDGVVMLDQAKIPVGVLAPAEVFIPAGTSRATVVGSTHDLTGIRGVLAPSGPSWQSRSASLAEVLPVADGSSPAAQATAAALRGRLAATAPAALTGGYTAGLADQIHSLYGDFPYVLAALAGITYLLLARAFRSLLLPLKALLANLLSVAAAYGIMVLVWQDGHGSQAIWGLPGTGAITSWIPLFVFAFLYGLSMDYEVFLLTRMREEYDRAGSTHEAIVTGIGRTGRLVTSAALILFLAMLALSAAPFTFLKVFATGIGAGILLDATAVRMLLVPALVSLFGRWNWYLPGWAAKLLRTQPSPLAPHAARGSTVATKVRSAQRTGSPR